MKYIRNTGSINTKNRSKVHALKLAHHSRTMSPKKLKILITSFYLFLNLIKLYKIFFRETPLYQFSDMHVVIYLLNICVNTDKKQCFYLIVKQLDYS